MAHGEPAGTGRAVLHSLAPSIRRLAITTNRLDKLEEGHVTFHVKDNAPGEWKRWTLLTEEFIRPHTSLHHGHASSMLDAVQAGGRFLLDGARLDAYPGPWYR